MRKLKLIQRIAAPIIMLATTQGVANDSQLQKNIESSDSQPALESQKKLKSRYELNELMKAKRSRDLQLFSSSYFK